MVKTRTAKRKSSSSKSRMQLWHLQRGASAICISDDEAVCSHHPLILVPSRENDFNMKTWWMVDLATVEESSLQGASALVKRCMIHGWDEAKARKVLASYRQFIVLKKNHQDWNAKILSPCYLVDQMWHCHILDVVNYCHDMMLLCGHVVGHNPDGAFDAAAKQKRDDTTRASLEEHFGSYDEEVWDYSPGAASENVNDVANQSEGAASDEESGPAFSDDTKITLRLKGQSGEETMFKLLRTSPMRKMFNAYAAREGVDVDSLRFLLNGRRVSFDATPAILELEDLDQIDVAYQQLGC